MAAALGVECVASVEAAWSVVAWFAAAWSVGAWSVVAWSVAAWSGTAGRVGSDKADKAVAGSKVVALVDQMPVLVADHRVSSGHKLQRMDLGSLELIAVAWLERLVEPPFLPFLACQRKPQAVWGSPE